MLSAASTIRIITKSTKQNFCQKSVSVLKFGRQTIESIATSINVILARKIPHRGGRLRGDIELS